MTNPVAVYSFRCNLETYTLDELKKFCSDWGKDWGFQQETSDTGYEHYQGYISLKKKRRSQEIKNAILKAGQKIPNYFEPAADVEATLAYCDKIDTRTAGPWTSKDVEKYIPKQYRNLLDKLYPYQKHIFETANVFDSRIINMIYCPHGNIGKSTIASLCELFGNGIDLPPVNDAEKLIQSCCDICVAKECREPSPIFIDMPRAMNKERLNGIYVAIEQIKKGKLFDLRYHYKEYWIDAPQIWVFSNIEPDLSMLSADRWRVWVVNENKELNKYINKPLIELKDTDCVAV